MKKEKSTTLPDQIKMLQPRFILIISLVLLLVLFLSAFFELYQTKREIYQLLEEEAGTLMSAITRSGANAIYSFHQIEELIEEKLFTVARLVDHLDQEGKLSSQLLATIAAENDIYRINVFDRHGTKIKSSYPAHRESNPYSVATDDHLQPIFNGQVSELVIGFRESRHEGEKRFAVAIKRVLGGAIVVNIDAKAILDFQKSIGVGRLMQDISDYENIAYLTLQDEEGLIIAAGVTRINSIESDQFLQDALEKQVTISRIIRMNDTKVIEFVRPFVLYEETIGLFRIGINADRLDEANTRMRRRLIIMSIVMGLFILIAVNFLTVNQNYRIIHDAYRRIQAYSANILEHMADAVVAIARDRRIIMFNTAAAKLFRQRLEDVINKPCADNLAVTVSPLFQALEQGKTVSDEEKIILMGEKKIITLVSTSVLRDAAGAIESAFVVIKDVTEKIVLEETIKRKEKLTAMGQLASGVAHEVRNPLNAIGMISQRLHKEFEPKQDVAEYRELTKTVVSEVKRINEIIQQFLKFARPPGLDLRTTDVRQLLEDTALLVTAQADEKRIRITKDLQEIPHIALDQNQVKQALLNLLQNAIDAIENGGEIVLRTSVAADESIRIDIIDNGIGMDEDTKSKIFNLYFTTKARGTGLGLSLVHQIVSQHNGRIEVESAPGKGTKFMLFFPV